MTSRTAIILAGDLGAERGQPICHGRWVRGRSLAEHDAVALQVPTCLGQHLLAGAHDPAP
jgi:hypothetical protein